MSDKFENVEQFPSSTILKQRIDNYPSLESSFPSFRKPGAITEETRYRLKQSEFLLKRSHIFFYNYNAHVE